MPPVFPFEFLGGTNTCGNCNAQESRVCVVHQDDTDLSTGSGLEWLWIERDDLWMKLTSINLCIIQEPLRWICQKDDTLSLLESGHQSSILLMIWPGVSINFKTWVFYKGWFPRFGFFISRPYVVFYIMKVVFFNKEVHILFISIF